jgi:hypothetical protein
MSFYGHRRLTMQKQIRFHVSKCYEYYEKTKDLGSSFSFPIFGLDLQKNYCDSKYTISIILLGHILDIDIGTINLRDKENG